MPQAGAPSKAASAEIGAQRPTVKLLSSMPSGISVAVIKQEEAQTAARRGAHEKKGNEAADVRRRRELP